MKASTCFLRRARNKDPGQDIARATSHTTDGIAGASISTLRRRRRQRRQGDRHQQLLRAVMRATPGAQMTQQVCNVPVSVLRQPRAPALDFVLTVCDNAGRVRGYRERCVKLFAALPLEKLDA